MSSKSSLSSSSFSPPTSHSYSYTSSSKKSRKSHKSLKETSYSSVLPENIEQDQEEIIQKAKEVEEYLAQSPKKVKRHSTYRLLALLFDLFKSELATNLALRDALLKLKTTQKETDSLDKQLHELFSVAQEYDPEIKTLDNIYEVFGNGLTETKAGRIRNQIETLKGKESQIQDENKKLQNYAENLENKLRMLQETKEKEVSERKAKAEMLTNQERELEIELHNLEQEHEYLENQFKRMIGKNSIERINESIGCIDKHIESLTKKMHVLDTRYSQKVEQLNSDIERLQLDISDLKETKAQIEKQLDETHREINQLTDPLTQSKDIENNVYAAKNHLEELKTELKRKIEQMNEISEFNSQFIQNIALLRTETMSTAKTIENDKVTIQQIENELKEKRALFDNLKTEHETLQSDYDVLNELEATRSNLLQENRKLLKLLDETNEHTQSLRVENQALRNSLKSFESELNSYSENSIHDDNDNPLSDEELRTFAQATETFRVIRNELNLPLEITPQEITDLILKSINT